MPTCGMAIVTRGMIYPPSEIYPVVCDKPVLHAVVEVHPQIRATTSPAVEGPAGVPTVTATSELRPTLYKVEGPDVAAGQDKPTVVSTDDLKPQIVDTEEE